MTTGETMSVLADAAFERFAPDWTDEPSSDDEEMKRAFFSELEKKHGGPISELDLSAAAAAPAAELELSTSESAPQDDLRKVTGL